MSQQLDIFDDSTEVALRNRLAEALASRDPGASHDALASLQAEFPDHDVASARQLLGWLQRPRHALAGAAQAEAAAAELAALAPHASLALGTQLAPGWLRAAWAALAEQAAHLPWTATHPLGHAAPMWLQAAEWARAADAAAAVPSWRRIPAPLGWMTEARHRLLGLAAALPLLAELAWLAPRRFDELATRLDDPLLERLRRRFAAEFDGTGDAEDWAWFPAWALNAQPSWLPALGEAEAARGTAPERALQLMRELLGLERQGRQHDLVAARKELRDLNAALFQAYMALRR